MVDMLRLLLAVAAASAAAVAVSVSVVADANAASSVAQSCTGRAYGLINRTAFPSVYRLRAFNLPRLTDGYAPRCLVAEGLAGNVQSRLGAPGTYRVGGARWYAGKWQVRRTFVPTRDGGYAKFTATHGAQRITFLGFS